MSDQAALLVPISTFLSMSENTRTEVLTRIGFTLQGSNAKIAAVPAAGLSDDGPADLTVPMARKLSANPISPKSVAILRMIAERETPEFRMTDAIKSVAGAETYLDIRGAWAGLTRRARNILGDNEADLIWWEDGIFDDEGTYLDSVGRVSALTHQSLRIAFGIRP